MANLKPNEVRLKKIDSELKTSYYKYDVQKVKKYLKALLTKCLEALAEQDFQKYNLAESVLYENIVRIGSSIENFEEFYSTLKNEVAIDFLKQLLGVENISVLGPNNPIEAIIITPEKAKLIVESWEYIQYLGVKKELYNYMDSEQYYKLFENEGYTILVNGYECIISSKTGIEATDLDSANFKFNYELDVLEAFVTNRPELITPLTITERIVIAERTEKYEEKLEGPLMEGDLNFLDYEDILYKAENDSFLVIVHEDYYIIHNKATGRKFLLYLYRYRKATAKTIEFLKVFSSYCLGLAGSFKEYVPTEKEPVIDPTEENVENHVEENVPTNEEGAVENG